MAVKKSCLYFIIDYPGEVNLDYVRNIGAILILRKPENSSLNELKKFQTECSRRDINLYIDQLFFLYILPCVTENPT